MGGTVRRKAPADGGAGTQPDCDVRQDNWADSAAGILDTYVKEGSTQNFSHDERLWISNTNYYGNRLTYLKVVDLPRLGANHFITSAKLCVRNVYAPTADTAIMCKEVLEDWDPETITYENRPDVSGVYQDYCRVVKNQYSWKEFDVTSLARKWYLGENHGVQLSAPKSESSFSQLHSSETANQPYFVLEYASLAGLESYLTYDHQSAGLAGTGSVSLVNGNLIFAHADTAMNGNRLPVSITHYYNSCDSDKDEFGMGYGWRTSLHQTLHKVLYNGEVEFVYTDGDGTEHFFKKNKDDQKKYSDQSGLSLTLEVGDENITITDKGDNVMTFPLVSETPTEDAPETEGADSEDSGCGRQRSHGDGVGRFAAENRICDGRRGSSYDDSITRTVGATGFRHRGRMRRIACASSTRTARW